MNKNAVMLNLRCRVNINEPPRQLVSYRASSIGTKSSRIRVVDCDRTLRSADVNDVKSVPPHRLHTRPAEFNVRKKARHRYAEVRWAVAADVKVRSMSFYALV